MPIRHHNSVPVFGSEVDLLGSINLRKLSVCGCAVILAATLSPAQSTETGKQAPSASATTGSGKGTAKSHKKKSRKSASSRKRGQQKIDAERARQIQIALIHEHYLSGKPSGVWDSATQAALQKYQADNGWQSKTVPDSRALIKLGLGPDHQHLLNPESAMTSQIAPPHSSAASTPAAPPDPARDPNQPQK